jgi:NAD(P)-dependent dehydrogenase (short-subunit alcohol dehydrogenase family)
VIRAEPVTRHNVRMATTFDPGLVLILGGRSEIGLAVASRLVRDAGATTIVLAARRPNDLAGEVAVLAGAGVAVHTVAFDADDLSSHAAVLDQITNEHGSLGTVVLAFGILGDQSLAEVDAGHVAAILHTDFVAQAHLLTELALRMRAQKSGRIVVFSSVAGTRVRRANYVYGSAKAGLDGFASGLSDALHGSGVQLLLVRPGFVVGRMTEGMKPAPFSSTADSVADAVLDGLRNGSRDIWVPAILRPVFFGMRLLPRSVWRKLPR